MPSGETLLIQGLAPFCRKHGLNRTALLGHYRGNYNPHPGWKVVQVETPPLTHSEEEKKCSACQKWLSISCFHKNPAQKDGLNNNCKECSSKANGKWYRKRKADPVFASHINELLRKSTLRRTIAAHGITVEYYNELAAKGCGICGGPPVGRSKRYHFDHDHETGEFRGLLCSRCNTAIGSLKDDVTILEKAIRYLREHRKQQIAA
jgi:hypothetical protein